MTKASSTSSRQFGVTKALIGDFIRHDEPHPTEPNVPTPWYALDYVYVMEPGEAVLQRQPLGDSNLPGRAQLRPGQ